MKKPYLGILYPAIVFCLLARPSPAESSVHERTGVEAERPFVSSVDFESSLTKGEDPETLKLEAIASLETFVKNRFGFLLSLPLYVDLPLASGLVAKAIGGGARLKELLASFSVAERRGPWRFSFLASTKLPVFGQGQAGGSLGLGFLRFLDPLLLSANLEASAPFGEKVDGSEGDRPLALSLDLSLTEVLSSRASLAIAFKQDFHCSGLGEGRVSEKTWDYGAEASLCLLVDLGWGALRLGFSGPEPLSFKLGLVLPLFVPEMLDNINKI